MSDYFGKDTPKLGFGLMRLPKLPDGKIDVEQVKTMVDMFLDAGLTYFDTAYVYDGGDSERAAKAALVERHPRESFTLATKLHAGMVKDEAAAKQELFTSLERTGAGYFDYYLLHALSHENIHYYDNYKIWDFVKEMKEQGYIRHWGFSFHDTPEMLDELLTKHPDAEFVQLQINYADWESPNVQSRACYEVARKHGKSVVVMEPVKGGTLANPPEAIQILFKTKNPDASIPSWAIRFVASHDGILTVLSGMSNIEQMADNTSYMKNFQPMSEDEMETIRQAQAILAGIDSIPCTGCSYCTAGCPMQIPIPKFFKAMNRYMIYDELDRAKEEYASASADNGGVTAADCVQCGQCESVCPQHINVIERLQTIAETLA